MLMRDARTGVTRDTRQRYGPNKCGPPQMRARKFRGQSFETRFAATSDASHRVIGINTGKR